MMTEDRKILPIGELLELISNQRRQSKRIVFCDGHFNIIHPGHSRFLQYCKQTGDFLIVGVHSSEMLDPHTRDHYFSQIERGQAVAALGTVDAVYLLDRPVKEFILLVRPEFYVKGQEFDEKQQQIRDEIDAVSSYKGKVIFNSGDVNYSSNRLVQKVPHHRNDRLNSFITTCSKYKISSHELLSGIEGFRNRKICVIGDTIVDQFVACDALGVSAEAPVLAIRELESREFVGGAAIVALHTQALGAQCSYISVTGDDEPAAITRKTLSDHGVTHHLVTDSTRPTTFKIRYVVDNQKILRVSRLREHMISRALENELIDRIQSVLPTVDGVIVSDFVYGVITPRVLQAITETAQCLGIKVFGDLQCSSQVGDVSKFKNICLITPTEREARIALSDPTTGLENIARSLLKRTGNEHVIITLGPQGLLIYTQSKGLNKIDHSEYFCALENHPVDVAGAGDALLAGVALSMTSGLNVIAAAAIGSCTAAIAVSRVGNIPISYSELHSYLCHIDKYREQSRVEVIPSKNNRQELWQGIF